MGTVPCMRPPPRWRRLKLRAVLLERCCFLPCPRSTMRRASSKPSPPDADGAAVPALCFRSGDVKEGLQRAHRQARVLLGTHHRVRLAAEQRKVMVSSKAKWKSACFEQKTAQASLVAPKLARSKLSILRAHPLPVWPYASRHTL